MEPRTELPADAAAGPGRPASILLVLSGPAGTGKTTLCQRLVSGHPGVRRVVTATTRAPRPGEVDGTDYHFLGEEEFDRLVAGEAFLEWARVHRAHRYGTLRRDVLPRLAAGGDLVMNIDVQGAASLRAAAAREPALAGRLVTVFIVPGSLDDLRARLRGRGTPEAEIERRMATAAAELPAARTYDYAFVTADREADYAVVESIWRAERHRVRRA